MNFVELVRQRLWQANHNASPVTGKAGARWRSFIPFLAGGFIFVFPLL